MTNNLPPAPSTPAQIPVKKPFYKRTWFIVLAAVIVLAGIGNALGGDKSTDTPSSVAASAKEVAQPQSEGVADAKQSEAAPNEEAPKEEAPEASKEESQKEEDVTSGGIDYGTATVVCDNAAKSELFPGMEYDPSPIFGKQKGQVGLSDDQFLAVYNVKVDGRKTAITCLVDGTKDAPNVISVREFEAR